jgi:N-acetylmuramoyl-L-alanine amidase
LNKYFIILSLAYFCRLALDAYGERLTSLGQTPDWSQLEEYQETITGVRFKRLLDEVYAPDNAYTHTITLNDNHARIYTREGDLNSIFLLRFARDESSVRLRPANYWRLRTTLPKALEDNPLENLRIVLDPGHIGGDFAIMENRSYKIGESKPIREGDLTLTVAQQLKVRLEQLGAIVWLSRNTAAPTTKETPESLKKIAERLLREKSEPPSLLLTLNKINANELQRLSELLFYRVSEIRTRANRINNQFQPDLVIALHFNAAPWPDKEKKTLVEINHLHVLINGTYSVDELNYDDIRFQMLNKLLSGAAAEEIALARVIISAMADKTSLPAYRYPGRNAVRIDDNPYVWARNLIANRLYHCPVIFLEPYVMNSREVFLRIQAGDYEGERLVAGARRISIFQEYIEGVITGLLNYYANRDDPD